MTGTSDEHLSLLEHLAPVHEKLSAVLVTTPQVVALTDMAKCISFTNTVNLPVLGLIENMSGYVCPCCGEISNVFSTGGGEELCKRDGLKFLGALPVDTELVELLDGGAEKVSLATVTSKPAINGTAANGVTTFALIKKYQRTTSSNLMKPIAETIVGQLAK